MLRAVSRHMGCMMCCLLGLLALPLLPAPAAATAMCAQSNGPVSKGDARLHITVAGNGPPVLMIPSLGRGLEDFEQLSRDLVSAGYTSIRFQPRWFGPSDGPEHATLLDLATDAAAVATAACPGQKVTVVGHALGNRVARAIAANHREQVSSVVLLAAGGQLPIPANVRKAIEVSASEGLAPEQERLTALQVAFFAPGQDASVWLTGWSPRAALLQDRAVRATRQSGWSSGGIAPLLVVQPTMDPVAPIANAKALQDEGAPGRVTLVTLDHASHAMLPEQPRAISAVLLGWLAGERSQARLQALVDEQVIAP